MSKFTVKIELQGLKIQVEGTHENAPRLAQRVSEQIGAIIKPPLLIEAGRNGAADHQEPADEKSKSKKKKTGTAGAKYASEDIALSHDPTQHGTPAQDWSTAQKAIWFLYVAKSDKSLSGYSIAKAFNKHFKSAGAINAGNVNKALEKERLNGTSSTVGADTADGTVRYYLTDAGKTMGAQLAKGASSATK
jgi:hypothetical protein